MLAWSFNAVFVGKHPEKDWNNADFLESDPRRALAGKPLTRQGYRGLVWNVLGDLDFYFKDLGMPAHNSEHFCFRCKCDRVVDGGNCWNDFRPAVRWRHQLTTPAMWRASLPPHPLWSIAGITVCSLMLDTLHVFDQGISQHALGNVLFEIAYYQIPGSIFQASIYIYVNSHIHVAVYTWLAPCTGAKPIHVIVQVQNPFEASAR